MISRGIFTVMFTCWLLSAVGQNEIDKTRNLTAENLRSFRTLVFRANLGDYRDSLGLMISNLIEVVKKTKSLNELKEISSYILICNSTFDSASTEEKLKIAQSVYNDLKLKALEDDRFSVEGNRSFGSKVNVKLTAQINGISVNGSYRVFWGYFLGRSLPSLIESNLSQGSSDNYNNPYDLQIRIPGYICFWMKDEQTNKYYRSSFDYKIIDKQLMSLTINFQPLK
jgi:hypothetical protein